MGNCAAHISRPLSMVVLGLENSGKTTLSQYLCDNSYHNTVPTIGHNKLTAQNLTIMDVGGHTELRKQWAHYLDPAECLLYVVDGADPARFEESGKELRAVLDAPTKTPKRLLIVVSKIDKVNVSREKDLYVKALGLAPELFSGHQGDVAFFCGADGQGIEKIRAWTDQVCSD